MPPTVPRDYLERLDRAVELVRGGASQLEAARACGISQGRLSEYLRGVVGREDIQRYVERCQRIRERRQLESELGRLRRACQDVIRRAYRNVCRNARLDLAFPCRAVFLDDLHVPFTDWDVVRAVIEREGGADCLIMFEAVNFDAFSRFDQTYLSDPSQEETIAAGLFELLAGSFGKVVCGQSNHMLRPIKRITRELRPEEQEYVLQRLLTVYDRMEDLGIARIDSPMIQIGDAVFGHYDRSLLTPGATVRRMRERVEAYADQFGFRLPVRAYFTGHTHRVSQTPVFGGSGYLYEAGCATHLPPYSLDHARSGPWGGYRMACGYGVAQFDRHGRIDLTESRVVHLGWARLPGSS